MTDFTAGDPGEITASDSSPTISIYQNPEHVGGILQQLQRRPLPTTESVEHATDETSKRGKTRRTRGGGGIRSRIPFIGSGNIEAEAEGIGTREHGSSDSARRTRDFTYSQAHYLYTVRQALVAGGRMQTIDSDEILDVVQVGDFVEFRAAFQPNALQTLMDILSPDVAAAFAHAQARSAGLEKFPAVATFDQQRMLAEQINFKAETQAAIARVAVEALQTDFRSGPTSEFYGSIQGADLTAVTICDTAHFVVEDTDRILDGVFTVLGKVTSPIERDVPILSRNKLLNRISPELVDGMLRHLRTSAAESGEGFGTEIGLDEDLQLDEMLDLAFPSRIRGRSFRTIPIAIYV